MDLGKALIIAGICFLLGMLSQLGFAFHCIHSIEDKIDSIEKRLLQLPGLNFENKKTQSEDCEQNLDSH